MLRAGQKKIFLFLQFFGRAWEGFFFFFFFWLFRAARLAYRRSQARGWIGAAYATATGTPDPSCIYNLYHNSQLRSIFNPLCMVRDWTCLLMNTSWVHYHWATTGTPEKDLCQFFKYLVEFSISLAWGDRSKKYC